MEGPRAAFGEMADSRTGAAAADKPGAPYGARRKEVLGGRAGGMDEDMSEGLGNQPGRGAGGQSWNDLNNKIMIVLDYNPKNK